MANYTQKLQKISQSKFDQSKFDLIQEELLEQFESARFNRFLISLRETRKQQPHKIINTNKQYEKA